MPSKKDDDLRTRAEVALTSRPQPLPTTSDEIAATVHELEVHKVELEMQIDELHGMERELESARDRYLELFDRAPMPYLDLSGGLEILEVNHAATALLGRERAELIGKKLPAFFVSDDADRFQLFIQSCLRQASSGGCEVGLQTATGEQVPVRLLCAVGDDKLPTLHLAMVDLTDVRRAESRFAELIERAPVAMVLVGSEHRIALINREAEGLFGYERSELIGRSIECLVPPALRETHVAHRKEFVRNGATRRMNQGNDVYGRRKDGSNVPIEVALTPVETGDGFGVLAVVLDLRDRRRLEKEIREAQKMEALGTLSASIAHDFNNLLMGQSGCATIALSMLPASSPARMYINEIAKSASTGAAITRRLLEFAHRDNREWAIFDLHEALRSSQVLVEPLLSEDITVTWQFDAQMSDVRFRTGELDQLLLNLVSNARDAMPRGGTLQISTSNEHLDSRNALLLPPGDYISLKVRDSGSGMSAEVQRRAFDPLFTTKPPGRGTGLGLSTVYSMVRQAGGRITIDSERGFGTTLTVLLPSFSGPSTTAPRHRARTPKGIVRLVVLLVEDDDGVRLVTRYYLEQLGHHVLSAASLQEAVECVAKYSNGIDLVLTDVVLPDGDATDLVKKIREHRPEAAVVYMSALSEEGLAADGRLEPGQRILQKPFDRDQLEAALTGSS